MSINPFVHLIAADMRSDEKAHIMQHNGKSPLGMYLWRSTVGSQPVLVKLLWKGMKLFYMMFDLLFAANMLYWLYCIGTAF